MSSSDRIILCMKWGTKYGPEYINRLYAMVRRHLTGDFRMVCLTDDSQGIRAEVECYPIPPLELPPGIPERGWNKLTTFTRDLHGLQGTALFLDVDVVITGPLDDFFTYPGDFVIIHDYKRPWRITGNSSVYRFQIGAYPEILDKFRKEIVLISDFQRSNWAAVDYANVPEDVQLIFLPVSEQSMVNVALTELILQPPAPSAACAGSACSR